MIRDRLLLAVITDKRPEASLGFAVSLLKFQVAIAHTTLHTDLHHFDTVDDALNAFATSEHTHLFVVGSTIAFDAELVLRALEAGHPFVAGLYPLPGYDWERVKQAAASAPDAHADADRLRLLATTHNLEVSDDAAEYGAVCGVRELGVFVISRDVVDALTASAPRHESGWLLFAPGVHEGTYESAERRLLRMWNGPVKADLARLCGSFGAVEFAGTISARTVVR